MPESTAQRLTRTAAIQRNQERGHDSAGDPVFQAEHRAHREEHEQREVESRGAEQVDAGDEPRGDGERNLGGGEPSLCTSAAGVVALESPTAEAAKQRRQQQRAGTYTIARTSSGVKKLMGSSGALVFSSKVEASTAMLAKSRLPRSRIALMADTAAPKGGREDPHRQNSRGTREGILPMIF